MVAQQELRLMLIGIVAWRHSSAQELIIIALISSEPLLERAWHPYRLIGHAKSVRSSDSRASSIQLLRPELRCE